MRLTHALRTGILALSIAGVTLMAQDRPGSDQATKEKTNQTHTPPQQANTQQAAPQQPNAQQATQQQPNPQQGAAQQANPASTANPANAPANNPGFGPQTSNDVSGYKGAQQNSSFQKDRNGSMGFDLGWLGLLGLAGLFGLRRGEGKLEQVTGNTTHLERNPGVSRS